MKSLILLCLIAFSSSACSFITEPRPYNMDAGFIDGAPPGTPNFRYGWKDGCQSGMAAYGGLHYKLTNDYSYDTRSLLNDEYQLAWELGFRHCRWYTSSWVKSNA